ncbi:MAG: M20 family peptidase, partial [Lutibacter sp.]|nr:M20 family peptidase [Lutibacter sp.]
MKAIKFISFILFITLSVHLHAQKLTQIEKTVINLIDENHNKAIDLLEKVVNINSGSLNVVGVKKVGDIFADEFKTIGFTPTWYEMPEAMGRAGHLFCELNTGVVKGKKI